MLLRLILLTATAIALTGCVAAMPEQVPLDPTPSTPLVPSAVPEHTAEVQGITNPEPTQATATSEATSQATPQPPSTVTPVEAPQGTTGVSIVRDGDLEYSASCLAGEHDDDASISSAMLEPQPRGGVTSLPGPYDAISFTQDKALKQKLDAALGNNADVYAYYVKELSTGRGAVHNGGDIFNAASIFKLFVMYEIFHQESLGLIEWSDRLVITPYYASFALAPTDVCRVITVGEAMEAMLSLSDNTAAVLLQDVASSSNINAAISALGLTDSGLFEDGLPITANDLALLMEAIATGNAISAQASADMLRLLDHDIFENGLMNGLPPGVIASRKTGNWSDATHVAGVVHAPSGPYVFIALTSNAYETGIIQALSSLTYEYFEGATVTMAP